MLSACMIVQDEEECLGRALYSICAYMDEIIILDGGSTDSTMDIVQSFHNAKLFQAPFPNNFAEQRNRSLEHAQGDWIFILDADEYIESYFGDNIPFLIQSEEYDAYAFTRKTFVDGRLMNPFDLDYQVRLFKSGCRYEGQYSEQLSGYENCCYCNLDIKHYKRLGWQQKDNEGYWDMGEPPPDGWVKVDDKWVWEG